MNLEQMLREKRDHKAVSHLEQYAPVWIINEKVIQVDEAIQFEAIFQHPLYGWVNRRYRYDGFNDVLYQRGQVMVPESDILTIQEKEPYLTPVVTNIPNSYGG
jgi:acyl-ACP thioesterase